MNEARKTIITRIIIGSISAVIIAIYYLSEIRPFEYVGYENNITRLQRYDAELNEAIVQTRFGILKYYDPISDALDGSYDVINDFKSKLQNNPDPDIANKLKLLESTIARKAELTQNFKRINPILINAIYQFSTLLARIIEAQASEMMVESCLEQVDTNRMVDKINNLFRGILIYINQANEKERIELLKLVDNIRHDPAKFPKVDLVLSYADKILELQPQLSKIDQDLFEVPIATSINRLYESFNRNYQHFLFVSSTYRIVLYVLVFVLLVVLRWAFSRLNRTVTTLNIEVQRKIKAQNELAAINQELEQRVADRTHELTIKNKDLNQALGDLKEAQDQLIIKEKMASVGMLTTGIAHEIKNPLNFVNNFSDISVELVSELNEELAANKEKLSEEAVGAMQGIIEDLKMNCSKIKEHGARADNIVKNMLLHSQEANVQKELINIKSLMEDSIKAAMDSFQTIHGKFEVKLEKAFDPTLEKILAAPEVINRTFVYILDNALYAMHEKKLSAPADYVPTLFITITQQGTNAEIKIRDNGTGIPKKSIDKVFEPFFTTKPTGKGNTGLGLSICYDTVVKQHKGELRVTSEEGSFTEFTVVLPINPRKPS